MSSSMGFATRAGAPSDGTAVTEAEAWSVLCAAARAASDGHPIGGTVALGLSDDGSLCVGGGDPCLELTPHEDHGWRPLARMSEGAERLFDLCIPLVTGAGSGSLRVGHLGQSLDGRIATVSGASQFITGAEDLRHTHRLRALFDAVIVGARTVAADDPRLTTRLVPGTTPARVVLDPRARLSPEHRVFRDAQAPTVIVVRRGASCPRYGAHVRIIELESEGDEFDLHRVTAALAELGLRRLFVEGGGITVSHFVRERLLERLHLTVAPTIIGSGAPALNLPPIDKLSEVMSMHCRRFQLGHDVLFDCDLSV